MIDSIYPCLLLYFLILDMDKFVLSQHIHIPLQYKINKFDLYKIYKIINLTNPIFNFITFKIKNWIVSKIFIKISTRNTS